MSTTSEITTESQRDGQGALRDGFLRLAASDAPSGDEFVTFTAQAGGGVERRVWQEREWLVVPTVAVVEGVLKGEYLSRDQIEDRPEQWNGRPVPIRHPQMGGMYVSANSPDILEAVNGGYFFGAYAVDGKLKGEMWLDITKIASMGDVMAMQAIEKLERGEMVEVSTAYWCDVVPTNGEFNGASYDGVQYNIKADHVALLPDQEGECSIEDGCGAGRRNAADEPTAMIALDVRASDAQALFGEAQFDAPTGTDDAHITLAYLGPTAELEAMGIDRDMMAWLTSFLSEGQPSFTADLTGSFVFYGDSGNAVGTLVQSGSLVSMRAGLERVLDEMGLEVHRSRPNYVPHITHGYSASPSHNVSKPGLDRVMIDSVSLTWGDMRQTFSLSGTLTALDGTCNCTGEKQMSKLLEQIKALSADIEPGEDGQSVEVAITGIGALENVVAELNGIAERLSSLGGVEGINEALGTLEANAKSMRADAVTAIKTHAGDLYSDDELDGMTLAELNRTAELAKRSARGASMAAAGGGTFSAQSSGDDGLVEWGAEA